MHDQHSARSSQTRANHASEGENDAFRENEKFRENDKFKTVIK